MKRKRTEVVLEFEEVLIRRASEVPQFEWCEECRERVQMVSPDEAARIAGVSSRVVYRWIENGKIHFIESSRGLVLACTNSLLSQKAISD